MARLQQLDAQLLREGVARLHSVKLERDVDKPIFARDGSYHEASRSDPLRSSAATRACARIGPNSAREPHATWLPGRRRP